MTFINFERYYNRNLVYYINLNFENLSWNCNLFKVKFMKSAISEL